MNWRLGARTLGKKALMSTLYPLLRPLVEAVIDADTRNIERWRYRQSLAETGRFVEEHLYHRGIVTKHWFTVTPISSISSTPPPLVKK